MYNKLATQYKRYILVAKNTTWKSFCYNQKDPFGIEHKFFTGKYFKADEILLQANHPDRETSNSSQNNYSVKLPTHNMTIHISPYLLTMTNLH